MMSIKTHYALAQAGATDNAKVSAANTLLPKYVLPSCIAWFPCNEGAGTTVTDLSKTGLVLDNGDASTTIAWSGVYATITHNNVAPNAGTVPNIGATDSFIMWVAKKPALTAIANFILGDSAGPYISCSGATIGVDDGSNSADVTVTDPGAGVDQFSAMVFDRNTNIMSVWYGTNAALSITSTPTDTADISSIGAITTVDKISFGITAQNYASAGVAVFSDGIPSDYVTFLQEIKSTAFNASPYLPIRWIGQ